MLSSPFSCFVISWTEFCRKYSRSGLILEPQRWRFRSWLNQIGLIRFTYGPNLDPRLLIWITFQPVNGKRWPLARYYTSGDFRWFHSTLSDQSELRIQLAWVPPSLSDDSWCNSLTWHVHMNRREHTDELVCASLLYSPELIWCLVNHSQGRSCTEFTKFQSVCVYNAISELIFKLRESKVSSCYPSLRIIKGLPADLLRDVWLRWSWTLCCTVSPRRLMEILQVYKLTNEGSSDGSV